jgi:acetylornithine/N-succinyldiaminopimelate aminotransferase
VSSLGHCHPLLIKMLRNQSKKLWNTGNIFTNEPALRLAKKLISNSFASRVFFANSGAEDNESAFKLARYYTIKAYNANKKKLFLFITDFMEEHFLPFLLVVNLNILMVLVLRLLISFMFLSIIFQL